MPYAPSTSLYPQNPLVEAAPVEGCLRRRRAIGTLAEATASAFPAALAFLPLLTPGDALRQLEVRIVRLEAELARVEAELAGAARMLPRLLLIEEEYLRAALNAELEWVRSVADDLRAGQLTWDDEWLRAVASSLATGGAPREEGSP